VARGVVKTFIAGRSERLCHGAGRGRGQVPMTEAFDKIAAWLALPLKRQVPVRGRRGL